MKKGEGMEENKRESKERGEGGTIPGTIKPYWTELRGGKREEQADGKEKWITEPLL